VCSHECAFLICMTQIYSFIFICELDWQLAARGIENQIASSKRHGFLWYKNLHI
jgi:hypothetical protein